MMKTLVAKEQIKKESNSCRIFYDGANCTAETDDTGTVKAVYTHGIELISKKDSTGALYFLSDHLGNTMATVNSSGSVVTRYEYDAFGSVRSESPSGDTRNKNKFVGGHGIVDDSDETGLVYMRARYYDSETGRFISRDPIGTAGGLNLYCYVDNNPIRYNDPTGKCKKKKEQEELIKKINADFLAGTISQKAREAAIRAISEGFANAPSGRAGIPAVLSGLMAQYGGMAVLEAPAVVTLGAIAISGVIGYEIGIGINGVIDSFVEPALDSALQPIMDNLYNGPGGYTEPQPWTNGSGWNFK